MSKLLNLDEIVTPDKEVIIKKKTYAIVERTVRQVIQGRELYSKFEATTDPIEQVQLMVKMILVSIPTMKEESLLDLPDDSLFKLMTFIMSREEAGVDESGKSSPLQNESKA
jgi:hypothetical protein